MQKLMLTNHAKIIFDFTQLSQEINTDDNVSHKYPLAPLFTRSQLGKPHLQMPYLELRAL